MSKIVLSVMLSMVLVIASFGQAIKVQPLSISTKSEIGKNASTAYIGLSATSPVSGLSISDDADWLSTVSSINITTNTGLSTNFAVTFSTADLEAGNYSATITISNGSTEVASIPVSLIVSEPVAWRAKHPNILFNYTKTAVDPTKVTPTRVGDILLFMTSNYVYISKGLTTNDWIKLAP